MGFRVVTIVHEHQMNAAVPQCLLLVLSIWQVHQTIIRDRGMSNVSMPTESSIVSTGPERKLAFYGGTWE